MYFKILVSIWERDLKLSSRNDMMNFKRSGNNIWEFSYQEINLKESGNNNMRSLKCSSSKSHSI